VQSRSTVPTKRSAKAFTRGARIGVWMTRTASVRRTASNGPENLASRSRVHGWLGGIRLSATGIEALARIDGRR
jgi:hypothetical protein